ncbi:adenine deaminase C-terminal domain-containing protein [Ammoniphilus sp. YIM 78166]|uniref:adenine deaminase C-terminal domain-containing protein n=1 Tax=Ammoniphilus sp. YIM 78166 TaxID=1644106 RepID=UPI0010702014|nr:adenine deaminase C-terminal domain-containing protein [Ammoniphilus sp. YIM 78166]
MTKPIRPLKEDKVKGLIDVSRGVLPATTWIRNGKVLNVYTGEVEEVDIVLFQDRIAYVGKKPPMTDADTIVMDASGYTLVPGYIEPHAHPFQLANIESFSAFSLSLGTTTMVNDNLIYYLNMGAEEFQYLLDYCSRLPIKNYWWARLDPQSTQPEMVAKFTTERLIELLGQESVLQAGELTSWTQLIEGDPAMISGITEARNQGKRIEGHNPGASSETLNVMAALGVTACHESIKGEEVMRRLRLGMYATLRHSSIRPDIPHLVRELRESGFNFEAASRLLMTTDGSMPPFHQHGCVDYLIQLAIENGVPAPVAYRMATLNPAVYYGLDQEIGGIAPGRLADILFLKDLHQPKPVKVIAEGRLVAEEGQLLESLPPVDWEKLRFLPMDKKWRMKKEWLDEIDKESLPILELLNAVIIRHQEGHPDGVNQADLCYAVLIDQDGKWMTTGLLKGFAHRLDAFAATITASQDMLVIGQCKDSMTQAVNELLDRGGGILLKENRENLFQLDLPLGGKMSRLNMEELIEETIQLVHLLRERGHRHIDPFYTMFFLSATHLPDLRLTAQGVFSIKNNKVIYPSKPL